MICTVNRYALMPPNKIPTLNVIAEQPRHAVNRHPWVVHDLRRTSRSLMSEAGVDRNVAERVLGHKVGGGVERTYDRFAYIREKGAALAKLAEHIKIILAGPVDNVVPYRPAS